MCFGLKSGFWSFLGTKTTILGFFGLKPAILGPFLRHFYKTTLYDTLWSEITMGLPEDNVEGYLKGEVWGGDDSDMRNFDKIRFSVIHGTADDNVHFQNAARLGKEIIKSGADFNSYFYADEAHSINYGKNSKEHVYRLIERKLVDCLEFNVL